MSAKEDILDAIRQGLTRGQGGALPRRAPEEIRAEAASLLHDLDAIRPDLAADDPVAAFIEKCANPALGVTLSRVAGWQALPKAVKSYLDLHGLAHDLAVSGDVRLSELADAGITTHKTCAVDQAAAISIAGWGIAETGSVVVHSARDQPILNVMLPRHWLVVVEESKILPFLDDYATYAAIRPRNVVIVTGSSGTTDIEGFFVRGAHGPGFVHVLLLGA
ncbi:LutC/YkgG family protein [Paracoccus albus]|uniref:LutC/YkgG family protein n=1 Tax=Paracoccus albus TaxID=3017784 RepID=UPI0022F1136B|nr:LUD domain-containing protein [Paracoccus albus]WBU61323.1 LUD domain-containing protein [Paracoccus albus]